MSRQPLPRLTPRLRRLASMVRPGRVAADIGTDHALLPVYLTRSGICPRAWACDVGEGPLQNAVRTISAYGMQALVTPVLCPGLDGLAPNCAQEILLAGMGGELIASILAPVAWLRSPDVHLLLQPMTMQEQLRAFLARTGFAVQTEAFIQEGKHVYVILSCAFSDQPVPEPDPLWCLIGDAARLAAGGDDAAAAYLSLRAKKLRRMLAGLQASRGAQAQTVVSLRALLTRIEALLLDPTAETVSPAGCAPPSSPS